jgi:hypothetical protein
MPIKHIVIAAGAVLGLSLAGHAAFAGASAPGLANHSALARSSAFTPVAEDWASGDRPRLRRKRESSYWYDEYGYRHARRHSGPPYGRCFMECINSGHPADFCQTVAHSHFCF